MEVVGAVSAAVPVATLLADKVMAYLRDKGESGAGAKENVDRLKSWLSEFQAFLKEKEKQEKNLVSKDLVDRIWRLTADIEDALDDFMFDVPIDHSHTTRLRQTLHELGHNIKDIRPNNQLSSRKQKIEKTINSRKLIDRLHSEATGLELPDS
ncbi:hypothetical protein PanWU01x14_245030 [Parasponia andersonii]|uniref:Disease resistance N-terminal domain-containing protein n=1 Tax=Parasponia andersonii TaxID=3476 RepID=A0A2P5BEW0_PARAD|nr:hypothetical protein PanWU01x14_245030 [Parasponia andersonii]